MADESTSSDIGDADNVGKYLKSSFKYLQNLWRRYFVVEPLLFLHWTAESFNGNIISAFLRKQACHVNLRYSNEICTADGSIGFIRCSDFDSVIKNITTFGATPEEQQIRDTPMFTLCKSRRDVTMLMNELSGKVFYIHFILPLILLFFAGGWTDRYNKHKTIMLLPIVGQCLYFVTQIMTLTFLSDQPIEISFYLCEVLGSLFGGHACFMMTVFSYMTSTTPEKDRALRFGIFYAFALFMKFEANPIVAFLKSIYSSNLGTGVIFQIAAIVYIVMFVKDPHAHEGSHHLPSHEKNNKEVLHQLTPPDVEPHKVEPSLEPVQRNILREFFDPTLLLDLVKFPFQKGENYRRPILLLLIVGYFLTAGPEEMQSEYLAIYGENQLSWQDNDLDAFNMKRYKLSIFGTILGVVVLSKLLRYPDSMIGMASAFFTGVSFFICAFATDGKDFYAPNVFDMFRLLSVVSIKAITSIITHGEGKLFAIFEIIKLIEEKTFPKIYDSLYAATLNSFPGAVFIMSGLFFVPTVLIFIVCYILLRRRSANLVQQNSRAQNEQQNCELSVISS